MRRKIKTVAIALPIIVLLLLSYELLWGKLFAYSPVKVGFIKNELPNIVVFTEKGSTFSNYEAIDTLIPAIEKYHALGFKNKPEIIIFSDEASYHQRSISGARFIVYPNGCLLVAPWAINEANEGKISLAIYLRHELSHTLLYQHMSKLAAYYFYPRWLLEGIAVSSSNQMGTSWYPSKEETYEYIRQGNYLSPTYMNTSKEDEAKLNVKYKTTFMYSEAACIVEYLMDVYGRDKFEQYMKQLLVSVNHDKTFKAVYGIDFEKCLQNFRQHVNGDI